MTLEQAIVSYEKSAERCHKAFLHCKAHGGEFYQEEAESNKICYEHDRQLAAWLRELQERRNEPEIIRCCECDYWKSGMKYCTHPNGMNSDLDNGFCSMAERRTDDLQHKTKQN